MPSPSVNSETFFIAALDCPDELALIEKGLASLSGIRGLAPNYLQRTLRIEFDPQFVSPPVIAARLRQIGFPGESRTVRDTGDTAIASNRLRTTTLAGGMLWLAASVIWISRASDFWLPILAVVSTALSSWHVAGAAWRAVRLLRLDMNALMTIAAAGALATAPQTGEWLEAPTAMFLFGLSLWIESFSLGRARRAVRTLVELTPAVAHRIVAAGHVNDVSPADLSIGDRLLVKPGERVPVDGDVVSGSSAVNEAPITGESLPIEKTIGDRLFAGSLNCEGALEIRATTTAHESTLAHIGRLVEQAQAARSPTERFVDRFARRYTPAVLALAVALAFLPPLAALAGVGGSQPMTPAEWFDWLHRGLVLLVIACPCALVISTPVTIVCGLHRATRLGVIIKGGEFLERLGQIDAVAFDKTGTLTEGRPQVIEVRAAAGHTRGEVLSVAAALEARSEHPLAAAIVAAARGDGISWSDATDFSVLRGSGVQATIHGQTYVVASHAHFRRERLGGNTVMNPELTNHGTAIVVLVGTRDELLGAICLADQPRREAPATVAELRRLGVKNIAMLTGDNATVAARIAGEVGITYVFSELLPADKVDRVRQLAGSSPQLAMVGDGVNDAPALAAARVGIAFGSQASATALESADVVVLSQHLTRIPDLIRLGRKTRRLLAQNIALAITIKAAVLLLAAAGLATMWMAVAADVGASLLVIFNGMRLLNSLHREP